MLNYFQNNTYDKNTIFDKMSIKFSLVFNLNRPVEI